MAQERANQRLAVPVVYVAAMFMSIMDTTIVNVALPTIGRDFHAPAQSVGIVSIAYLVSLAIFIPVSGWLGDRIGGRRALLGAIGVFTVASALCGLSSNLGELVACRILQGVGGAVMTPVGLSMLFRVYPPAERVRISSILAIFTAIAPALGPILGGLFTTYLSWRWVFFVNVPIGVATILYGLLSLTDHTQPGPGRLDVPGFVLSGFGLGTLMYGLSEGPVRGWFDSAVLATISVGVVLLVALIVVELRATNPLIDLHIFRNRLFSAATSLYGLGSVAYLGALFLAALFFQDVLGMSPLQSGLTTFPSALGVIIGGQIVTRVVYWRLGPRRIVLAGLLMVAMSMVLMALVTTVTNVWLVRLVMLGLGLGIACVFISAQATCMATISKAETGRASSIFNAGKQLGGAVGVALLSTVLAAVGSTQERSGHSIVHLSAFHDSFLATAIVSVLAIGVALSIHDSDAATTMVAPQRQSRVERAEEATRLDEVS